MVCSLLNYVKQFIHICFFGVLILCSYTYDPDIIRFFLIFTSMSFGSCIYDLWLSRCVLMALFPSWSIMTLCSSFHCWYCFNPLLLCLIECVIWSLLWFGIHPYALNSMYSCFQPYRGYVFMISLLLLLSIHLQLRDSMWLSVHTVIALNSSMLLWTMCAHGSVSVYIDLYWSMFIFSLLVLF